MGERAGLALPRGRQFALTWGIPDDFGGMTSALLRRSRAFVEIAHTPVDVLTFDARSDYPLVEARLRERGELVDGIGLINLWDWLRKHSLPPGAPGTLALSTHAFAPLGADVAAVAGCRGGIPLTRTLLAVDGATVQQVDYFREDGSLLATDRRAAHVGDMRSVVLCDADGTPARSWSGIWPLYRYWLDQLRNRKPSFLLVDSKTVARFAMTYRRKRAVLIHVVHNSHLSGDDPLGPLRESRRAVFEQLSRWDGVVVLTDRQRRDVEARVGPVSNLSVLPNSRDLPEVLPSTRTLGRGVVVASLTARKRVDHAVGAVLASGLEDVTLDVFGDGDQRSALEQLAAGDRRVRFHGHRPDAREQLAEASFILLTSRSEGLPLVLVEAMAVGCIPIAYDVHYGPSDLIVHGWNGFLVADGDERGIADAILELRRMSPARVRRMRANARRSVSRFSDAAVTRMWAVTLRAAARRKASGWDDPGVTPLATGAGAWQPGDMPALQRPRTGRVIAGVCAGIARRFGWNTNFVRLIFVLSCLIPGPQFLIYIALWILLPLEPESTRTQGGATT